MTDEATSAGAGASPPRRPSRVPLVVALVGAAALLGGIALAVLGQSTASNASGNLDRASHELSIQQGATKAAQRCARALRGGLSPQVAAAQTLLTTVAQLTAQDAEIIAAAHAQQSAGAQAHLADYNKGVSRANAAVEAANPLINAANEQLRAYESAVPATPDACTF